MAKQLSPDAGPSVEAPPKPPRRKNLMMGGALLGIMIVEGLAVFVLAKHFGAQPAAAEASEIAGLDAHGGEKTPLDVEVEVVKLRAQNEKSQQMLVYDMTIAVTVSEKESTKVSDTFSRKRATIQDRLSRVVRALDPQRFSEPDLSTLRQQFRHELSQIVGNEDAIREVLIPSIVRYNEN
jgi:hypothetical protein